MKLNGKERLCSVAFCTLYIFLTKLLNSMRNKPDSEVFSDMHFSQVFDLQMYDVYFFF